VTPRLRSLTLLRRPCGCHSVSEIVAYRILYFYVMGFSKIFLFEPVFPVQKLPRSQQSLPIERQMKIIADESNPVYRHRESKSRVC